MAYFKDLSEYEYLGPPEQQPGTRNVGWLTGGVELETEAPSEAFLADGVVKVYED
jgi:hypothetical protein